MCKQLAQGCYPVEYRPIYNGATRESNSGPRAQIPSALITRSLSHAEKLKPNRLTVGHGVKDILIRFFESLYLAR